jgi:phosphatidylglycerophosphatase A
LPNGLRRLTTLPKNPAAVTDLAPQLTRRFLMSHPAHFIALGAGSGLSRLAPGTVGTLWAWAVFLLLQIWLTPLQMGVLIAAFTLIGWWACTVTAQHMCVADPGAIVWDEVIAFWLVLIFIMPATLWMQALAFVLFRFFDAVKPGPIGIIDRHFKKLEVDVQSPSTISQILWRGFGIMVDDLAAAFFTLLIIALVQVWIR